jgi:2-polyprenyl-3-methyl-5-hydroxy-6-metoxy-1,4-benzoquinol methylase
MPAFSGSKTEGSNEERDTNSVWNEELVSPAAHPLESSINWDTDTQRKFWNAWDTQHLNTISEETRRRADEVLSLISSLNRQRPRILEIGCGNGWLVERLLSFGPVTGVDIADEPIQDARCRIPSAEFYAGDILQMDLPNNSFDLIVTLETFSHVADQPRFIELIASLLSDRGYLILTTQNRSIYMRNSRIAPPAQGQLRHWVTIQELRALLSPRFDCLRSSTVEPGGDRGILRLVNSRKLTSVLSRIFSKERVIRLKERLGFGQTLVLLARKRG